MEQTKHLSFNHVEELLDFVDDRGFELDQTELLKCYNNPITGNGTYVHTHSQWIQGDSCRISTHVKYSYLTCQWKLSLRIDQL